MQGLLHAVQRQQAGAVPPPPPAADHLSRLEPFPEPW